MARRIRLGRSARAGILAGLAGGVLAAAGRTALRARRRRALPLVGRDERRAWPAVPPASDRPVVISAPKADRGATPDPAA